MLMHLSRCWPPGQHELRPRHPHPHPHQHPHPRQNGRHFCRRYFPTEFREWHFLYLIRISLKFVHKSPIDNKSALVQVMAWHRPGHKPLPEPMPTHSLTHICDTRLPWVNLVVNSEIWPHQNNLLLIGEPPFPTKSDRWFPDILSQNRTRYFWRMWGALNEMNGSFSVI